MDGENNKNGDNHPHDLTDAFNAMSFADRKALEAASLVKAITGLGPEDTKRNPWHYAIYAGVFLSSAAFVLLPGSTAIPSFALYGWICLAKNREGSWAQWAYRHIADQRSEQAMMENNRQFIHEDPHSPQRLTVEKTKLGLDVFHHLFSDFAAATKIAQSAAKSAFKPKEPKP